MSASNGADIDVHDLDQDVDLIFEQQERVMSRLGELAERIENLEAAVEETTTRLETLEAGLPGQHRAKADRIQHVVAFAKNVDRGPSSAAMSTQTVQAAAGGVSDKTAARYMRDLEQAFGWARVRKGAGREPNQLVIDLSNRTVEDCLADVESLAADPEVSFP